MSHFRQYLKAGNSFKITSSQPIIILVMSDFNVELHNSGEVANYYGGFFFHFPVTLEVSADGYWNVLLETREFSIRRIQYSIEVVSATEKSEVLIE